MSETSVEFVEGEEKSMLQCYHFGIYFGVGADVHGVDVTVVAVSDLRFGGVLAIH